MKKIISCVIILSISLIIIILFLVNSLNRTEINEDVYFYDIDMRVEKQEGLLKRVKDDTIWKDNNENIITTSKPIYYTNKTKFIIPNNMTIVDYTNGDTKKLSYFSEISKIDNEVYLNEGEEKRILESFLFDGNNLYIFLEPTTLKIGDGTLNISEFSYVELINNESAINIFDYENQKMVTLDINNIIVKAIFPRDNELDIKLDILNSSKGEQLLFRNVDVLPKYE